jgi:YHS domain-containing protein
VASIRWPKFTEGKALFGRPELELNLDGAVWRFSNEGNRGAFAKHPEVYSPRFGGYDPVAIGRGRSVPGHPFWVVVGQRLYLFYSEQTCASFLADPGHIIDTAERKWPEVARNLGQ